jgi:sortase A
MNHTKRYRAVLALAVLLVAIGVWQVGEAGYLHAKALLAQHLLVTSWAETVATGKPVKPWPWADTWPVARLTFESSRPLIVLAGGSGRTMAFAPGHVYGTPLPGRPGLSLIGGHRDTHFRALEDLEVGAAISAQDATGTIHRYRVTDTRIVDSRTVRIAPHGTRSALALVTCWPFDSVVPGGPMRYVVVAESEEIASSPTPRSSTMLPSGSSM